MKNTISYMNIEKAIQLAVAYAGIQVEDVQIHCITPKEKSLVEIELSSYYMQYTTYVDMETEEILGFDCEPIRFPRATDTGILRRMSA